MPMPIKIISINQLKPHEQTCPDHLFRLQSKIAGDGIFTHPIVVDRTTKIILDGHHRHRVLERLGYTKIPCLVADYLSSQIKLTSRCQSDIKKETTQTLTGKSRIQKEFTQSLTGKARIQNEILITLTAKGNIKKEISQIVTAKANIN